MFKRAVRRTPLLNALATPRPVPDCAVVEFELARAMSRGMSRLQRRRKSSCGQDSPPLSWSHPPAGRVFGLAPFFYAVAAARHVSPGSSFHPGWLPRGLQAVGYIGIREALRLANRDDPGSLLVR